LKETTMFPLPLAAPLPANAPFRARLAAWLHDLGSAVAAARGARAVNSDA
jgi:hypothetical protein